MSDDEKVTLEIAVGGCSQQTAQALSALINAALEWRLALEDGDELRATDELIEVIDDFVDKVTNDPGEEVN